MAFEFALPDIGEGLAEATVVRWLVQVGEEVSLDAPMVEVETDKAVVEIPAPRAGMLLHHGVAAGGIIQVDELLAVIGEPGESWTPQASPSPPATVDAAPIVGTLHDTADVHVTGVEALPSARKLARDLGVDVEIVAGSGPGGRIMPADVEAAVAAAGGGPVEAVRLSPTRRRIAANMERSWREIPHVVTYGEADATPLLEAHSPQVPLEAQLIHAVAPLLAAFPEFNATLAGDRLLLHKHFDIGLAVNTPDGLMVVVIRGAATRDIPDLAEEVSRLAIAARDRTATPDDLRGATFTVSNIGAVGGGYGTPLIPYGTTAILSVGRADPRPVVAGDSIVVGRRFPLSLSYDHRVIDGALGRRFMAAVVDALERPSR